MSGDVGGYADQGLLFAAQPGSSTAVGATAMTASPELYGLLYYSYESHQTEPEIRFASRARRSVAGVQPLRTDAKTGGIRRAGSQQSNAGRTCSGRQSASTQSAIRLDGRPNTLPLVRNIVR